jgi:hypothetical protein
MLKPIVNPKLSLRARSLFYYFAEKGRVFSADDLKKSEEFSEGRDVLQAAINELKDLRYIKSVRLQNNGQWIARLKFTDEAKKLLSTVPSFSGHLYIDNYITTSTSDISTRANIVNNPNGLLTIGAAPQEGEEMGWNLDGDEETPKAKRGLEEPIAGTVGKIEDRQARLNAKYKKPVKAQRDSRNRINTPEELWSTTDLIAEFYDLVEKAAPNTSSQVNNKYLATWINKQVSEGTQRYELLKAMRMFFADPRNLNDLGIGKPLWQRFFSYYPTIQGVVKKPEQPTYSTDKFKAHQEKMMRLLEGE